MQGFGSSGPYGGRFYPIDYDTEEANSSAANSNVALPRALRSSNADTHLSGLGSFSSSNTHSKDSDHSGMNGKSGMSNALGRGGFGYQQRGFTSMTPAPEQQFNGYSGLNPERSRYQVPQRRNEPFARPDSSLSNGTFATQPDYTFAGQDRSRSHINSRDTYNGHGGQMGYHSASYDDNPPVNGTSKYNGNGRNSTNANGLGAGFANMKIGEVDFKMPSDRALAIIPETNSNGYQNGYVNGDRISDRSRNDSLVSTRSGPSAFVLAQQIKSGLAEDPYDRTLSRYDTAQKLPNPTLGPARFKDSKMFSTADDLDSSSSSAPPASSAPRYAIMPASSVTIPDWLQLAIEGNMVPTLDEAFDALPLIELCRTVQPSAAGVLRVKDIPYGTTRQEMIAFVGRNAQVLRQPDGAPYHAVHILMERESGKTMDCFIEVATANEAAWVVKQFAKRVEQRRPPKVGDRVVEVLYSSQDELMAELFPRAKHVRWSHGSPMVDQTPRKYYQNQKAAGFQGFLHAEELVAMGKHASLNERSPFASKSPCRVYEAMITLLYKYPWYATENVTIQERRSIYDCAINLVKTLINDLRRANNKYNPLQPTPALLQELAVAMLCCPGFTEKQKATIVGQLYQGGYKSIADGQGINVKLGGRHEFSAVWPFSALSMTPDTDPRLMQYYTTLFRQATSKPGHTSLADRQAAKASGLEEKPMGNIKVHYGDNPKALSIAEVAKYEYDEIEKMLSKILSRSPPFAHGYSAPETRCNSNGPGSSGGSSRSHHSGSAHSMPFP